MPATEKLRDQRVLEVDLMGDTLVVIPAGDAVGFGLNVVNNEVGKVLEFAKSPRVKHLIIDLSRANYFGSVMIGEFIRLGTAVRDKGGRIALCGASADMQDVLRIMKVDTMWEVFPRREDAIRAIARIPFRERVWRQRRWFAAAFLIVAGVAIYILIPRPEYERIFYPEVRKIWDEIAEMRRRQASDTEWEIFSKRVKTKLEPIVYRLERYANSDRMAARELLWVARDSIPAALNERNQPQQHPDAVMGGPYLESVDLLLRGLPAQIPELPSEGSTLAEAPADPQIAPPADPAISQPPATETPERGPPEAPPENPASAVSPEGKQ